MKTELINGIVRLTASEGMWLTNGASTGSEVWLSPNEQAENWVEVDVEPTLSEEQDEIDQMLTELEGLI